MSKPILSGSWSQVVAKDEQHNHAKPESGFTLVELLVVIGIIAILIALLLPALNKAQFQSKTIACASNQHQIYIALTMYANDNNGYMPGTNTREGNWGATYLQNTAWYPWENNANAWTFLNAATYPPDASWGGPVRWYGVGCLVGNRYLPPSTVVSCTDFYTSDSDNFSYNEGFTLTPAYYQTGGDVTKMWTGVYPCVAIAGSYIFNSVPYYAPDAPAHGKLGGKGRAAGMFAGYVNQLNIDALLMCFTGPATSNDGPGVAHQNKGVNCTFRDGHVDWLPLTAADWAFLNGQTGNAQTNWPNSSEFDLDGRYNTSFWNWATSKEPNE